MVRTLIDIGPAASWRRDLSSADSNVAVAVCVQQRSSGAVESLVIAAARTGTPRLDHLLKDEPVEPQPRRHGSGAWLSFPGTRRGRTLAVVHTRRYETVPAALRVRLPKLKIETLIDLPAVIPTEKRVNAALADGGVMTVGRVTMLRVSCRVPARDAVPLPFRVRPVGWEAVETTYTGGDWIDAVLFAAPDTLSRRLRVEIGPPEP